MDLEMGDEWFAAIDPGSPEWMVNLHRQTIDAYRAGDLEWVLEQADPEIEIVQPAEVPGARTYKGHEGLIEAFLDWPGEWEDFGVKPKRVFALSDNQFVVVAIHRGRSRTMGIDVEGEVVWLYTLRNGLTTRWDMFMSLEQALEAAGAA
jgi:ketosteroid isomerase-like protein